MRFSIFQMMFVTALLLLTARQLSPADKIEQIVSAYKTAYFEVHNNYVVLMVITYSQIVISLLHSRNLLAITIDYFL